MTTTPEETQDTEVEEMVAQLLLRTYDRCFVRGRVPPEVGSSIAHYDLFLKEELANLLHHQLQKAREEAVKPYQDGIRQIAKELRATGFKKTADIIERDLATLDHSELDQEVSK